MGLSRWSWRNGRIKSVASIGVRYGERPGWVLVLFPVEVGERPGDRADLSRRDQRAVDAGGGHDAARGRGDEHLVGAAQLGHAKIAGFRRYVELGAEIEHGAAGDARQHAESGRLHPPGFDGEDIEARP